MTLRIFFNSPPKGFSLTVLFSELTADAGSQIETKKYNIQRLITKARVKILTVHVKQRLLFFLNDKCLLSSSHKRPKNPFILRSQPPFSLVCVSCSCGDILRLVNGISRQSSPLAVLDMATQTINNLLSENDTTDARG